MNKEIEVMERVNVNCDKIKISNELKKVQKMMPISDEDYSNLKTDIEANGVLESIVCYEKNKVYYLLGGFNRLSICQELAIEKIPVVIYDMNQKQREAYCIDSNLNRRHLSNIEKKNLVIFLTKNDPSLTTKGLARKLSMSVNTVKKHRISDANVKRSGQSVGITKANITIKKQEAEVVLTPIDYLQKQFVLLNECFNRLRELDIISQEKFYIKMKKRIVKIEKLVNKKSSKL